MKKNKVFLTTMSTNSVIGDDIKKGDIMLYGNDCLVLFYKDFNTSYRYTKMGYIQDTQGLEAALGKSIISVKWEY